MYLKVPNNNFLYTPNFNNNTLSVTQLNVNNNIIIITNYTYDKTSAMRQYVMLYACSI